MVQDFDLDEGCDFLASLLPDINKDAAHVRPHLEQICGLVQGYPLVLSQVAGFIRTGGCSLGNFIAIFNDKKASAEILSLPVPDYHATFATVWALCHSSLSHNAKRLLNILSYLDPDSIPYEFFKTGAGAKGGKEASLDLKYLAEPLTFHASLQDLTAQSLIRLNVDNETISIHRYLQKRSYEHLCNDGTIRRIAFEEALHLLTNTQPEFDNTNRHMSEHNWEYSEKYVPHIKVLAAHFLENPEVFVGFENQLGTLVYQCAVYVNHASFQYSLTYVYRYQFERFHHQAASETFKMANVIFGLAKAPNIVVLSDCKRIEGRMLNELNKPEEAAKANQVSLNYAEKAVKEGLMSIEDGRIPRILTGFGNSLSQLQEFDRATEMQLKALRMGQTLPGNNDAIKIIQLNLGFLFCCQGNFEDAERVLSQSLDEDPDQPMVLYPLGNTHLGLGRVDEGLAAHLKALKLYIERFGPQHAISGVSMYKVGQILLQQKKEPHQAM
jgi:tetratricopeptide (TPR) repeat protein